MDTGASHACSQCCLTAEWGSTASRLPVRWLLAACSEHLTESIRRVDPTYYISLPFFGPQSEKLKIELNSILVKFFPSISFRIILVNSNKIGSFFRYKDSLPVASRSSVIYQFTCPRCGDQYVGSTRRMLSVRCSEHAARSHRTRRRLAVEPQTALRAGMWRSCIHRLFQGNRLWQKQC